jgi:hypothetical protein
LIALAHAHDVLMEHNWKGADLRETIDRALNAFVGNGGVRLRLEGPPVHITPKVALALAMALQELTTNATKYGALSNDTETCERLLDCAGVGTRPCFPCGGKKVADRRSSRRTIKGSGRACSSATSRTNSEAKWMSNMRRVELSVRSTFPLLGMMTRL